MNYLKIIIIIIALLGIDLLTKYAFFNLELIPNVRLPSFNTGISFSIIVNQFFVEIITIVFLSVICYLLSVKKIPPMIGILLISWSLGNLIDRLFLWGVRDFIWLGFGAVFNVADIYINLGVLYAIWFEFIKPWLSK